MHHTPHKESVFLGPLRYFFIALFSILGACIGLVLMIILFAALKDTSEGDPEITYNYTPQVKANASDVRKVLSKSAPVILKININGVIGSELLNRRTIAGQLVESRERALKNNRVKAILLAIDSPGGTVTDADGIYREIKAYKEKYKTPVFAYVDGLCASGGMYIASAADKIYVSESSLIGSVGVLAPSFLNFSQLMEKVGVQSLTLYAGKGKDNMNPLRPWTPGEQDNIKDLISDFYTQFVDIVVTNRPKISKEKLVEDYGALLFSAEKAKEFGFVDGSGLSLNETLKLLAKQIGIEDDYYQVIEMESKNWLSSLFNSKSPIWSGQVKHQLVLTPEMDPGLMNQFLYLYRPEP